MPPPLCQKNMKKKNNLFVVTFLFAILFAGCATVSTKEALPTYNIKGTTYYPLLALCDSRSISWQYDTFTRNVILNKDSHRLNLKAGDGLVLVDGRALQLADAVDIYQGTIVVPYKFKEKVIDVLFKESSPQQRASVTTSKIKKVVIDAGHGGNDPGAIGRTGLREDDINLDIGKRLSILLRTGGIEVVMTRTTDRFVPLSTRADIANNSRADLFISIHSNANRVRSMNGFEVYYIAQRVNDSKRALSTAQEVALNLDSSCFASRSLDLKATLWDMIYTSHRAESMELSQSLCKTMGSNLDVRIIGIKGAAFQVLRDVRMPAVLIEVGFLSNSNEERMLKNNFYRQKIAEAIAEGLLDYSKGAVLMEVVRR